MTKTCSTFYELPARIAWSSTVIIDNSIDHDITIYDIIFSTEGIRTDLEKIQGIIQISPTIGTQQLQSLLGIINFMQWFMHYLSHHTCPIHKLLKCNKTYYWDDNTNAAFYKLSAMLTKTESITLEYFQGDLPVTIWAITSKKGLALAFFRVEGPSLWLQNHSPMLKPDTQT